ncbi:leucyl/phenylalanyl-tRNA--protein transferase, partial [Pseudomonas sp. ATCC 13867]
LIDCQMPTQHLHSFGARAISRREFSAYLRRHLDQSPLLDWTSQADQPSLT